jgi:hypothetical protein
MEGSRNNPVLISDDALIIRVVINLLRIINGRARWWSGWSYDVQLLSGSLASQTIGEGCHLLSDQGRKCEAGTNAGSGRLVKMEAAYVARGIVDV